MKTYEITTTKVVTQQQIDDVLADAFEHGVTHWCDIIRATEDSKVEEPTKHFSDDLTRGGTVELHAGDFDESLGWYRLDVDMLLKELSNMQFNFDDYDAMDTDALVQRAIFGEVVYG